MRRLAPAAGAAALLLLVYVGLSFLNSTKGYLGTDTGGKVATLKVMTERGRFDPDLGYWAEKWDPGGTLHPLAYTSHTASGKWVNVTTLPALWIGWRLYQVGGYRLSLLVPMAGSVAAAFAALALLRRLRVSCGCAWGGFALFALASPLTIYALDFWEHSIGVALMAWAVVHLCDALSPSPRHALAAEVFHMVVAGGLFGVAATMRTEALVYLAVAGVAWAFAALLRRASVVQVVGLGLAFIAAVAVPLGANEVAERVVVKSTIRTARTAGTAASLADLPATRVEEAAVTLVALEGSDEGIVLGIVFVALLVFAAVRSDPGMALVAVGGAGVIAFLRFVGSGLGFVPGLTAAWVSAAAAACVGVERPMTTSSSSDPATVVPTRNILLPLGIALGALPLVIASQPTGGAGPQWGGRYLLTSGLLLGVLGWAALTRRPRCVWVGFVAIAVVMTSFGLIWTAVRTSDVARVAEQLQARPEPVVVSGVYHLAREGGAFYGEKRWLTLSPTAGPSAAASVLTAAGVTGFASVEFAADPPLRYPGYEVVNTAGLRLFDGVELRVSSWRRES